MMRLTKIVTWAALCCLTMTAWSQKTYNITGRITDAKNGDPVPFANVAIKGKPIGTTTNFEGYFSLTAKQLGDSLLASSIGYQSRAKALDPSKDKQIINIALQDGAMKLQEVTVKRGENPAWRILRGVVNNKERNDRKRLSAYEYDSYSKMELDMDNISSKFKEKKIYKKIEDVIQKMEKLKGEDGQVVIPAFISESISKFYYRESPQRRKEQILKNNVTGVAVNKMDFITQMLGGNMFQNYNFYDNFVPFLGKDIPSPIANDWKSQYNYFLSDSMQIGPYWCYLLEFDPKRKQDLGFTGSMWIDSKSFALLQIDASIGKEANLNFIEKIKISQELEVTTEGAWLPSKTRFLVDLAQLSEGTAGVLVKMYVANRNFAVNKPRELSFFDVPVEIAEDSKEKDPIFWKNARPDSLSKEDRLAMAIVDTVRNIPIVKTYVEIAEVLTSGWLTVGKWDLGPYVMAIGANKPEGLRLHVGFRSNANFSKKWIIRGFLGFGTTDLQAKYGLEVDRILNRKRWTVVGIKHNWDLERLGLATDQIGDSKLFLALTRLGNFKGGYWQRESEVFFKTDAVKNWTFSVGLNHRTFEPMGDPYLNFRFRTQPELGNNSPLASNYEDTHAYVEARFAKNENFVMDGNERITLNTRRIPVITLRYTRGLRDVAGGQFNYDKLNLKFYQTFRLGVLGRSNYLLNLGYTPSILPAPLLFPHVGNQTPFMNRVAFNAMSYYEFVSDRYASLQFNHQFEGLLFNRIPAIKKLKWRLIALANVLIGDERQANSELTPRSDERGQRITDFGSLEPGKPYVEVGYGIDNIFKFIRIQAIHRLTYTEATRAHEGRNFTVRASFHFSF
jgi:Family of unknown function (DUF5686)/CarboxypepD_reg-like domain